MNWNYGQSIRSDKTRGLQHRDRHARGRYRRPHGEVTSEQIAKETAVLAQIEAEADILRDRHRDRRQTDRPRKGILTEGRP
jgi:hypothetical protein